MKSDLEILPELEKNLRNLNKQLKSLDPQSDKAKQLKAEMLIVYQYVTTLRKC